MKRYMLKISATVMCLALLSSCGIMKEKEKVKVREATSVDQILEEVRDSMKVDIPVYSELKDYDDYVAYFSIMDRYEYLIKEIDGEDYIFISFYYYCPTAALTGVKSAEHTFRDNGLSVKCSYETKSAQKGGCFPSGEMGGCILKMDKDYDPDKLVVMIDEQEATRFTGGRVTAKNRMGMADEDMNIVLPIRYDNVFDFDEGYYRVCRNGNNGIVDDKFNEVLSTKYSNIIYLGDGKFAAMIDIKDSNDYKVVMLDSEENILKDDLFGFIEADKVYGDYIMYHYYGDSQTSTVGVLDKNLDFVIEPLYKEIVVYEPDTDYKFFVVENFDEEYAAFDADGVQKTEFEGPSSFYETAEKYYY